VTAGALFGSVHRETGGQAVDGFFKSERERHLDVRAALRLWSWWFAIGEMTIGPISQVVGREATLVGAGLLMIASVVFMLSSRDVRTLRHRLPDRAVEESFA